MQTLKRIRHVINVRLRAAVRGPDLNVDMNTSKSPSLSFNPDSIPAVMPTKVAAIILNRKPQTLRKWACFEDGPIRPVRINGRLAWRVSDILALVVGEVG